MPITFVKTPEDSIEKIRGEVAHWQVNPLTDEARDILKNIAEMELDLAMPNYKYYVQAQREAQQLCKKNGIEYGSLALSV